jgi:hypothetical protein
MPLLYNQSFGQQCVFTINKIDAHALQSNRVDTVLNIDDQQKTPLTYCYDSDGIIKIEYGVKDDDGEFTGIFRYYFIEKKLWLADQIFAKYIFDDDGRLKFWLSETWTESETNKSADFVDREKRINSQVDEIRGQLATRH